MQPCQDQTSTPVNLLWGLGQVYTGPRRTVGPGASLVVQWLESPMQCRACGFHLWSGISDPTCCRATKPACHN